MLFSIPLYQLTHRLVSLDYLFPHYFPFFLEMPACRYVITALQIIFSISALYRLCQCRKCTTQQKGSSFLLTRDIASRYGFWSLLRRRLFFWYFLVMKYCTCQVITSLPPPEEGPNLSFYTLDEQLELLSKVGAFLYPLVIVLLAITDRVQVDPFTATNRC